jgi:copper homeostasis protein
MIPDFVILLPKFFIKLSIMYSLEVCSFTVQTCITAQEAGAARVELCDNPLEGGTTPSYGTIKNVREKISIQLFPIIRPRCRDYYYDDDEWQVIADDIKICRELGCDGISVGVQKIDGEIDGDRMKLITEMAWPMEVTCNRAFDAVPDPFKALEVLIDAGCKRVLTSGLAASAPEGADLLKKLVDQAGDRIIIMPGAGVRSGNIPELIRKTGAREFHTSARKAVAGSIKFSNPRVTDAGSMYVADREELDRIMRIFSTH